MTSNLLTVALAVFMDLKPRVGLSNRVNFPYFTKTLLLKGNNLISYESMIFVIWDLTQGKGGYTLKFNNSTSN